MIKENAVKIGDLLFEDKMTGFYLESDNRLRKLYTGLSLEGFESIFTVPTGTDALTLAINGRIMWSGEYVDGSLKIERNLFRPAVPPMNSLRFDQKLLSAINAMPLSN